MKVLFPRFSPCSRERKIFDVASDNEHLTLGDERYQPIVMRNSLSNDSHKSYSAKRQCMMEC